MAVKYIQAAGVKVGYQKSAFDDVGTDAPDLIWRTLSKVRLSVNHHASLGVWAGDDQAAYNQAQPVEHGGKSYMLLRRHTDDSLLLIPFAEYERLQRKLG